MVNTRKTRIFSIFPHILKAASSLAGLFLLIEFFDEFNYSIETAALPAIRTDLGISYVQVGLLLGLPGIINTLIEPFLMLLGDTRHRKRIILGGGVAIVLSLVAIASTHNFYIMLAAMTISYSASGAFVSLSQATLMDLNPGREAPMMARWTVSGSLANFIGPLILAGGFALGFGWRWSFFALAGLCLLLVVLTWLRQFPSPAAAQDVHQSAFPLKALFSGLWESLRTRSLVRWLVLLQFSDLLLDVLTGYLALYFTDVIGFSVSQASLMMSVLMLVGFISNVLLIPILERFPGRQLVRVSAAAAGILYAAWLLAPWLWAKIGLIILVRLVTLGWYEVLQGEAFAAYPGRSGTVMAGNSLVGLLGSGISFFIGWLAAQAGLPAAMWFLLIGPISLLLFVPRHIAAGR